MCDWEILINKKFCSHIKKVYFQLKKVCYKKKDLLTHKEGLLTSTKQKPTANSHDKYPRQKATVNSYSKFSRQIATTNPHNIFPLQIIRGHKDLNSAETLYRGFLVLESWCRCISVLEIPRLKNHHIEIPRFQEWKTTTLRFQDRCCGFLSPEKMPWNLNVTASWSWDLDVVAFSSWNPNVVVNVPRPHCFRFY